jgi:hypothetical protein
MEAQSVLQQEQLAEALELIPDGGPPKARAQQRKKLLLFGHGITRALSHFALLGFALCAFLAVMALFEKVFLAAWDPEQVVLIPEKKAPSPKRQGPHKPLGLQQHLKSVFGGKELKLPSMGEVLEIPIFIDSEPPRAMVLIDGKPRGKTPLMGNALECSTGSELTVEISKKGYLEWRGTLPCTAEGLKIKATLKRH